MVTILAAHHPWLHYVFQWSPGFDWVALGTMLLAGGTVWLGLQTKRAAEATAREAAASRAELEASQRPVVVPTGLSMVVGELWVAVKNVGAGPALTMTATLVVAGDADNARTQRAVNQVLTLGAGDTDKVVFLPRGLESAVSRVINTGPDLLGRLDLTLDYVDAAGQPWVTDATTSAFSGQFTSAQQVLITITAKGWCSVRPHRYEPRVEA